MPSPESVHIVAAAEGDIGARLDHLLSRALADIGLSRTRIQALIRDGAVREEASGAIVADAGGKVKSETRFVVSLPPPKPSPLEARDIPLDILYEDEFLLVVNKPAGLAAHPAPGHRRDTLVNALLFHCGETLSGIGGVSRPGIVHRLDKDTSGVLVAAKQDGAHRELARQFAEKKGGGAERVYIAFAWGRPVPDAGSIRAAIGRASGGSGNARLRMRVAPARGGREAVTRYRVSAVYGGEICRLLCRLETGRTHQIRAHLAHIGHPLLGDALYGSGFRTRARRLPSPARETAAGLERQALHAWRLGFRHPADGREMRFEADMPEDLRRLEAALTSALECDEMGDGGRN